MKAKKPRKRVSKIEKQKRLFAIQEWIIGSFPTNYIINQIIKNKWCQSDRHAFRMIQAARLAWVKDESEDIEQKRKLKVLELNNRKRTLKAVFRGTPAGIRALTAVDKEIIKIEGLAAPVKVEQSGKDGEPIKHEIVHTVTLTPEEIKEYNKILENEF